MKFSPSDPHSTGGGDSRDANSGIENAGKLPPAALGGRPAAQPQDYGSIVDYAHSRLRSLVSIWQAISELRSDPAGRDAAEPSEQEADMNSEIHSPTRPAKATPATTPTIPPETPPDGSRPGGGPDAGPSPSPCPEPPSSGNR
jgi:uncharacterized membrane protein